MKSKTENPRTCKAFAMDFVPVLLNPAQITFMLHYHTNASLFGTGLVELDWIGLDLTGRDGTGLDWTELDCWIGLDWLSVDWCIRSAYNYFCFH